MYKLAYLDGLLTHSLAVESLMYFRSLKSNIMNENKWNEKTWGKVIQVLFWPLGIYMMFTVPYFSKTT